MVYCDTLYHWAHCKTQCQAPGCVVKPTVPRRERLRFERCQGCLTRQMRARLAAAVVLTVWISVVCGAGLPYAVNVAVTDLRSAPIPLNVTYAPPRCVHAAYAHGL